MTKGKIKGYFIFIITILLVNYLFDTTCERRSHDLFKNLGFNGVLTRKFIDTNQHQNKVIELLQVKDVKRYIFRYDNSGLFVYLSPNDSIVKKPGIDEVIVYRRSKPKSFDRIDIYLHVTQ
jgi:hypothetical protein